jgi:hypothetical protein
MQLYCACSDAIDPLLSNILLSQGRSIESFHSDFYHGLLLGKVGVIVEELSASSAGLVQQLQIQA